MWFRFVYYLSILEFTFCSDTSKHNNVCNNFDDYYNPDNSENCYYDPDILLETPHLIKKYSGKLEIHDVTTKDGYILTLFRIAKDNPKGVILMHHSISTYSHIYLWQGRESLAIKLWQSGFDIWLANQRGTTYSDRHVNMTTFDVSYWDFGFHEMGFHDVSSELELIRRKTNNSKVIYFGHSLGSTVGLVYAASKQLEAKNYLKTMILVATPAYFKYGTSLIYGIAPFVGIVQRLMRFLHIGSPLFMRPLLFPLSKILLRKYPFILYLVNQFVYLFCGYTPDQTDPRFFNYDGIIYLNNFSLKTLYHFAQLINSNYSFQLYDYGKSENLRRYRQEVPPLYPVKNITIPTLLVSSYNDTLIALKDSEYLYDHLSPEARVHGHWKISGLNHLDYLVGLHRKEIFVDRLLDFLQQLE